MTDIERAATNVNITGIQSDADVSKVLNLTEQSTLASLRSGSHKDVNGNVIVDPDLSNPTRPRMERPLDTIRAFEKAIDNGYKRRSSYLASQPSHDPNNQHGSRRSSAYFGESSQRNFKRRSTANNLFTGYESGPSPGRHSAMSGGYYGDRRPDSQFGGSPGQNCQRYGNRVMSEGAMPSHQQRPYGQHNYHQSQNTMNTDGSDSTGPWANSTDPSSENSSIDRNVYGNNGGGYGQNGYNNRAPITEEGSAGPAYGGPVQYPQQPAPRRPIPLGNATGEPIAPPPPGKLPSAARGKPGQEEKKKGWLKRRFSKKE
ncbi:hypothetical protein LTR86_004092 [Recurvomyces mirabilis]|nr:hypothetical protein LTR86_004092 [Recurvomyces mirabilis]